MKVHVRYFTILREITGKKEEEIEFDQGVTVDVLLKCLSRKYGGQFTSYIYDKNGIKKSHLRFLINGKNIDSLIGFNTKINNYDEFSIIPPVGGG